MRIDMFYFTPTLLSPRDVQDVVDALQIRSSVIGGHHMFNLYFPPGDRASEWQWFNPSDPSTTSVLDREELLILLTHRARTGLAGLKLREPVEAASFLRKLLLRFGGFVGFGTERWEPIYTAESGDELVEEMREWTRKMSERDATS